jgi:serine/arginine repetitive matrix protein 2
MCECQENRGFIRQLNNVCTYLCYFYCRLRETHEIAQAQQQKNAKLREAFGISDYFVEGTSFDPERKAREELAKSEAIQKELQADKDADRINRKKYALVRTPSPEKSESEIAERDGRVDKKKKKKRNRDV